MRARSSLLRAIWISVPPVRRQMASTIWNSPSTSDCAPSSSTISTASAFGKFGWTAASAASIVSLSIISTAAGMMPAEMISDTAAPAASVDSNAARIVFTDSGTRRIRNVTFVTTASVPSDPTSAPSKIEARRVERRTAKVDHLAIRQHGFDAEHVMNGEPVLQTVRAARNFRRRCRRSSKSAGSTDRARSNSRSGRRVCVTSRLMTPGSTVMR